jgi:adenylate cyclase
VGSTVNLASRVESYTLGGQVLLDESTRRAARAPLRIDSSFEVCVKGVDGLLTLAEVGGIGEPWHVALKAAEQVLHPVEPPLMLQCAAFEGKHVGGEWMASTLVALSASEAELVLQQQPPPLTNLLLRLHDGPAAAVDFYAKTHPRKASEAGRVVVRFTSLPRAVGEALAALEPRTQKPSSVNSIDSG